MIFGFHNPHPIGSTCIPGCQHCQDPSPNGITMQIVLDKIPILIPAQPLLILREATAEEWILQSESELGRKLSPFKRLPEYFYEVATD